MAGGTQTVISIHEFKKKWGTETWRLLIETFIKRAPSFPGDLELARAIGEMVADLGSALKTENNAQDIGNKERHSESLGDEPEINHAYRKRP